MPELIEFNAHRILGLDGPTSDAKILSRSKQISNLLNIDEDVDYEVDHIIRPIKRNTAMVNAAIQKLQNQRQKMIHSFFWFNFKTEIDDNVQGMLAKNDIANAIRVWENAAAAVESTRLHYKRNLGVLYLVSLENSFSADVLRDSLAVWKSILDSGKLAEYLLNDLFEVDRQKLSSDSITQFTQGVISDLSDIYTDLYHETEHPDFIKSYLKIFKFKGGKLKKTIFEPSMQKLNEWATTLSGLNVAADKVLTDEERTQIRTTLDRVRTEIDYLKKLALAEDGDVKVVRDQVGDGINRVCLDLHNHLDYTGYAIELLSIAEDVAGTTSLKNKIKDNLQTLREQASFEKIAAPIKKLLEAERWADAIVAARRSLASNPSDDLRGFILMFLRLAVFRQAQDLIIKGSSLIGKKDFAGSARYLNQAIQIIDQNYEATELSKLKYDELKRSIQNDISSVGQYSLGNLETYQNRFKAQTKGLGDQSKEMLLNTLFDAMLYQKATTIIAGQRKSQDSTSGCVWVVVVIVILIAIGQCSAVLP